MVSDAQWHNPFVAHLPSKGPRLRETNVVRLARHPCTYQTRLGGNKVKMLFVADAPRSGDSDDDFIGADPRLTAFLLRLVGL